MTSDARFTVLVTISLFMLGAMGTGLVYLFRGAMRWATVEHRLEDLVDDVKKLVADKDRVHTEMLTTIREDRAATDKRLRWLEEHLWKRNGSTNGQR